MRNVTPCRLDVSKDRRPHLHGHTIPWNIRTQNATPHTLNHRSAVFGTLGKSGAAAALDRLNSDTVCLCPSDSDLSKDRGYVKDRRVRTTSIPTLPPTETSESHTSEDYTADRAANLVIYHNLPQNERKWPRQVS